MELQAEASALNACYVQNEDGTYSFGGTLRMMALDFVLYGVLATYFDKVLPNEYGSRLPPLFFIT